MSYISASICLTEIEKSKIKEHTNGKKYLNITISQMREPNQFGQTHHLHHTDKGRS